MQGAASSQEGARHRRTSVMTDVVVGDYVGDTAERLMDTASTLMPNTEHDDAVQASGALQTLLVVLSGLHLVTVAALCPRLRLALIVSVAAAELLLPE